VLLLNLEICLRVYLPDGRSNLVLHLRKHVRGWQSKSTQLFLSLILDADAIISFLINSKPPSARRVSQLVCPKWSAQLGWWKPVRKSVVLRGGIGVEGNKHNFVAGPRSRFQEPRKATKAPLRYFSGNVFIINWSPKAAE